MANLTPDAKFSELINSERVTVQIGTGSNRKSFQVPKALLCKISWFDRAFREGHFKEGAEGKISMPEEKSQVFEAFQYFLYHNHLAFENDTAQTEPPQRERVRELGACFDV